MVNLTILNILFIGLFISLVKLIYEEIKVKLNQKASRIILASKLNTKETILILNIYRNQEIPFSTFKEELVALLEKVTVKGYSLLY